MKEKRTLIACGIYQDEVERILSTADQYDVELIWLSAGLDNNLSLLESTLSRAITENQTRAGNGLRLMFGRACLPNMTEFAAGHNIATLPDKNCIAALLGDQRKLELEKDKTMVVTPAWVRKMWLEPEGVKSILGWTEVDFRINLGRFDRILVLDAGLNSLSDEEILEAFDLIQVPFEFEPCDLSRFQKVFLDFLA